MEHELRLGMSPDWRDYESIEVSPVQLLLEGEIERVDDDADAHFFGVYGRTREEHLAEHLVDLPTRALAEQVADLFRAATHI